MRENVRRGRSRGSGWLDSRKDCHLPAGQRRPTPRSAVPVRGRHGRGDTAATGCSGTAPAPPAAAEGRVGRGYLHSCQDCRAMLCDQCCGGQRSDRRDFEGRMDRPMHQRVEEQATIKRGPRVVREAPRSGPRSGPLRTTRPAPPPRDWLTANAHANRVGDDHQIRVWSGCPAPKRRTSRSASAVDVPSARVSRRKRCSRSRCAASSVTICFCSRSQLSSR